MEQFDILLKNGKVIDPYQNLNSVLDVGIKDGSIKGIGKDLPKIGAKKIYDISEMIITPGLIDLHCHPAKWFSDSGVDADEIGLKSGVTLLCDAGTAGAHNFKAFKKLVVEKANTEVLCFLNVASTGLVKMPEVTTQDDMDLVWTEIVAKENPDLIKGFKLRLIEGFLDAHGLKGVEKIKRISTKTGLPLMMHIGQTRPRQTDDPIDQLTREAVNMLECGDIISHFLTWEPGGLIRPDGHIYPELQSAQKRGVVLDACHGLNHFSFTVAKHALEKGIIPSVLSTDLCDIVIPSAQSLTVVMSKFLNLGLPIEKIIELTTSKPSAALRLPNQGGLKVGEKANITVIEIRKGNFHFTDGNGGNRMFGDRLIDPRFVVWGENIIPAFSNYHLAPALDQHTVNERR